MHGSSHLIPTADLWHRRSFAGLGMRRVGWVRIAVGDDSTTCEVVGVGHRLPRTCRVSLATALDLAARGVPVVTSSSAEVVGVDSVLGG